MQVNFDVQTSLELDDVAEWYNLTPQEYVKLAVQRALDDVADNINPQLDCWAGRYSPG